VSAIFFAFIANGCLKSNCTDQVKNSELFGIWYYYKVEEVYRHCDSSDSTGNSFSYSCIKLRLEKVQYQFSSDRFIEDVHSDTTIDTTFKALIDPDISKINKYWFYTWGYNFHSTGEKDWFVDNNTLVICQNNSLCFESECDVYTWKIENGKLYLQNGSVSYVLTREDLFEKIKSSVKNDTAK
jgi:hypothetical protein